MTKEKQEVEKQYMIWPNILMAISAAALIGGMFLPWVAFGILSYNIFEQNYDDKWIFLGCAIVVFVLSVASAIARKKGFHIFVGVVSILASAIAVLTIGTILNGVNTLNSYTSYDYSQFIQYGYYITLAASIVMLLLSIISLIAKKEDYKRK